MHKNKFLFATGLILLVFALSSFNISENKDNVFKNLQVLPKDISELQLNEIMDAYCTSLNVKCSFCHTDGNMESDTLEEKIIARKMMVMTNEINEKYFGKNSGTVGCMTCHNGKINPNDTE